MKNTFRTAAAALIASVMAAGAAAPAAELWERWLAHDPESGISVDHSPWNLFLEMHLSERDGISRIDYASVDDRTRTLLQGYLESLAATPVDSLSRAEQLAFWINLYNALTVETVLASYPVDSIRDISPGFLSSGPWSESIISIAGEELSLDDIEHRILRPIWQDARLHYAVNCASLGCPNLAGEAFTPANLERLLDHGARAYVNHPRGVRVQDGSLIVSSIYKWFIEDFGGSDREVIEHLKMYANEPLRSDLEGIDSIESHRYNWSLNRP